MAGEYDPTFGGGFVSPTEMVYQMGQSQHFMLVPQKDVERRWFLYQCGSTFDQDTFWIKDHDYSLLVSNPDTRIAFRVGPHVRLRPFDRLYLWNPELNQLIPLICEDNTAEILKCSGVWEGLGGQAVWYTKDIRPYNARGFKLIETSKTPKFDSGKEALEWLEENS